MNRSKKLYVLTGVFVFVCAVAFGVTKYEEKKEEIKNSDEIILEVASEDVTSLSWTCGSESLAFHKDDTWLYDEDEAFPVNEEKVNELLSMFEEFGVSFMIENVEDYGQYGLENPVCTINMETADNSYEILVGEFSDMDEERYVSIGDGNVYLVKNDPVESFDITLSDMIQHDEFPDFEKVSEITFTGTENYQIVYEEGSQNTYCDDDVYFTEKEESMVPLSTSNVDSYLSTISNLNLTDYVTYNATEEEIAKYGLNEPELTVNVQYAWEDEETEEEVNGAFILNVARDPEEQEKESDDEDEEITAYARVGESQIIYQLTTEQYNSLMAASYNDLRHAEVLTADLADVEKIDVVLDGETYVITVEEDDDEILCYYNGDRVENDDFQNALEALTANNFTEEEPEGKEEISMTIYLDNDNNPEVSVELYRYDGSYCLAVVDGEPVSLVERGLVVDLVEAVNAIVLN